MVVSITFTFRLNDVVVGEVKMYTDIASFITHDGRPIVVHAFCYFSSLTDVLFFTHATCNQVYYVLRRACEIFSDSVRSFGFCTFE